MKERVRSLVSSLVKTGINDSQDLIEQQRLIVFNKVLLAILAALVFMTISDLLTGNGTILLSIGNILIIIFLFALLYYRLQNWALLIFTTLMPVQLFVLNVYYGEALNINYVYPAYVIIVLLSFDSLWLKVSLSAFILSLQVGGIYYLRYYGSIIEKDIPLMDGIFILLLPVLGLSYLVLTQVNAIKRLYEGQKKVSMELEKKNRELSRLVQQNEDKNHLLAIIAHDLKGPASSFVNLTKNITYLIEKNQPERLQDLAHGFEVSGYKLYYTISNLLDWVTTQQGEIVAIKESFELSGLIEGILSRLEYQLRHKNVFIQLALRQGHLLHTDKHILQIIVLNIISNAIKYSRDEGKVTIRSQKQEQYDVIEIEDEGVGMDKEVMETIKSGQIVTRPGTKNEKGHGIGLRICFSLIEHLNGRISINVEKANGATFSIHIPRGV